MADQPIKYNSQIEKDEHDDSANITGKRVVLLGWNPNTLQFEKLQSLNGILQSNATLTGDNIAQETGGNLAAIKTDVDKIPSQGQALAAASMPVVLPAAQVTTLTPPAAITNYANETGGNLAAIKADTDKIPSLGSAAATSSVPVTDSRTSLGSAKTTVTTAGTRVQLGTNTCSSITIKALSTNTGLIYVGTSTVASSNGFQLSAGESISLDITNTNLVYIDSAVNGEGITSIWIN